MTRLYANFRIPELGELKAVETPAVEPTLLDQANGRASLQLAVDEPRKASSHRITLEDVSEVVRLYSEERMSVNAIARERRHSWETVAKLLSVAGLRH